MPGPNQGRSLRHLHLVHNQQLVHNNESDKKKFNVIVKLAYLKQLLKMTCIFSCIIFFWFWQQIPVHTACRFLMKADTPTFWSLIIWQIFTNCIYHRTMGSRYLHQLWTYFLCIFKFVTQYLFICDNFILCLPVINLLAETHFSCCSYFYLQQINFVFTGDKLSSCNQFSWKILCELH